MNISLHIERLILDGLPVGSEQGARVQAAVEGELARLLAAGGLAPSLQAGGAVPSVQGSAIKLSGENNSAQLGQQIAQAVYQGIGK